MLAFQEIKTAQELQIHFFLQDLKGAKDYPPVVEIINQCDSIEGLLNGIEILSFKKRLLMELRKHKADWKTIFLDYFFKVEQAPLRDYIMAELTAAKATTELKEKIKNYVTIPIGILKHFFRIPKKYRTERTIP